MRTHAGTVLQRWEGLPLERWRAELRVPDSVALAETASTNDVVRELAEGGAEHGTIVLSEYQSAGRGRHGRPWMAPHGSSLLLSMVLRPSEAEETRLSASEIAPVLPLRVGMATVLACEQVSGRELAIKWPNDVMADGAKLGGVLCESVRGGPGGAYVIAGIGINVLQHESVLAEFDQPTTSLLAMGRRPPSRAELLRALVPHLISVRSDQAWGTHDYHELVRRDWLHGQLVRLEDGTLAQGEGIRRDGGLALRIGRDTRVITSGTVRRVPEGA